MKRFSCDCGSPVYFHNTACTQCGARLGFEPQLHTLLAVREAADGTWESASGAGYALCGNALQYGNCNWLVGPGEADHYCVSCRLNRTIPDLSLPANRSYWDAIEAAKRRLVYALLGFGLDVRSQARGWPHGLAFDFVADADGVPAPTGHEGGIITINVAEADDVIRAMTRKRMNERYRTLLGHFRHESGHYYFTRLIDPALLATCRELFGDETTDYATALAAYYAEGPPPDWSERHISAYAAAHPAEDWAETWAHYLHIADCLETAESHGLASPRAGDFEALLDAWHALSVTLNELNRSMGLADAYPFVISNTVAGKLAFVHRVLRG